MLETFLEWLSHYRFIVGGAIAGMVLKLWSFGSDKRSVAKLAKSQDKMFHSGFRWKRIDLKTLKHADQDFYDRVTKEMSGIGFASLGDVEYLHATESEPKMRAGIRIFGVAHGTIYGAAYHVKVRGWMGMLMLVLTRKRNIRTVEFETAFSDGRWVTTNNLGDDPIISTSAKIQRYKMPRTMSVAALHKKHIEHVKQFLTRPDAPLPVTAVTLEQMMVLEEQQHELSSGHRAEVGTFSEAELATVCPNLSTKERAKLVAEAKKLAEAK